MTKIYFLCSTILIKTGQTRCSCLVSGDLWRSRSQLMDQSRGRGRSQSSLASAAGVNMLIILESWTSGVIRRNYPAAILWMWMRTSRQIDVHVWAFQLCVVINPIVLEIITFCYCKNNTYSHFIRENHFVELEEWNGLWRASKVKVS